MGLISEISKLIKQYNEEHKNDTQPYNIFKVLEVSDKEVIMCRFLTDLLNPNGEHNRGSFYLKMFLNEVLQFEEISDSEIAKLRVFKEYPINMDRRIDIVIRSSDYFIPIEVKINAGEQKSQCYDYYHHAIIEDKNTKVIYLTKFGTLPSEYSTMGDFEQNDGVSNDRIICISFSDDIRKWLEKLIEVEDGIMKQMIVQYRDAINEFTDQPDEEILMIIADEMISTEDNFRTGLQIASNMNRTKANLIKSVMQEFEVQMQYLLEKYNLEKESKADWYCYEDKATEDFYKSYSTYPGINYIVKGAQFKNENQKMWLRIEIEHSLFAGFCMFDYLAESKEGNGNQVDKMNNELKEEILKYLNVSEIKNENWWLLWHYLPTGSNNYKIDTSLIPNFMEMNEAAIQLADQEKRKRFVLTSIEIIEKYLLMLLK